MLRAALGRRPLPSRRRRSSGRCRVVFSHREPEGCVGPPRSHSHCSSAADAPSAGTGQRSPGPGWPQGGISVCVGSVREREPQQDPALVQPHCAPGSSHRRTPRVLTAARGLPPPSSRQGTRETRGGRGSARGPPAGRCRARLECRPVLSRDLYRLPAAKVRGLGSGGRGGGRTSFSCSDLGQRKDPGAWKPRNPRVLHADPALPLWEENTPARTLGDQRACCLGGQATPRCPGQEGEQSALKCCFWKAALRSCSPVASADR